MMLFKSILLSCCLFAVKPGPRFRVLALAESSGHHIAYSGAAKMWLDQLAADSNFVIDYIHNTANIDSAYLSKYRLFIQLDYPPYGWKDKAARAFEQYINEGRGGWIGFHHATLLGEFDGYGLWDWFYRFMGRSGSGITLLRLHRARCGWKCRSIHYSKTSVKPST
ncbi:ThuA domain-containing protein [Chitinophaga sedimenti]|uniref:ThuA domain-containing protein n=1 Tax=Chitinophaga sedimenti TaxID=2033606 RepID=UPI0027E0A2A1|nr:ThuA domain-containing protein [Chitinophaga sedimenti]